MNQPQELNQFTALWTLVFIDWHHIILQRSRQTKNRIRGGHIGTTHSDIGTRNCQAYSSIGFNYDSSVVKDHI
jgi:hypothetical protein